MKQEVLNNFDMPWMPVTALIIFIFCYFIYAWWTYKKENKSFYTKASMIPLEEAANERRN